MSQQQEHFPESQRTRQAADHAQRGRQAHRSQSGDVPKSEHPATFEESIPPYSYRAQDQPLFSDADPYATSQPPPRQETPHTFNAHVEQTTNAHGGGQQQQQQWHRGQGYWRGQVPWWARPQPRSALKVPTWLIVLIVLLVAAPIVLPIILSLLGLLLTGLLVILLIPFIILGGLLITAAVIFLLALAGVRPRRWGRWWRW